MSKRLYEIVEIKDLKDMLNKTKSLYGNRVAFNSCYCFFIFF